MYSYVTVDDNKILHNLHLHDLAMQAKPVENDLVEANTAAFLATTPLLRSLSFSVYENYSLQGNQHLTISLPYSTAISWSNHPHQGSIFKQTLKLA